MIVSDGPVARISVLEQSGRKIEMGGTARGKSQKLFLEVHSTAEFGELARLNVIVGDIGATGEKPIHEAEGNLGLNLTRDITLEVSKPSYLRLEVFTTPSSPTDKNPHWCFTNPIWIEP